MNSVNATFIKLLGIAILSLGLYACGGGNGDLPSTAIDIPLPAAPSTGTDTGSTSSGSIESSIDTGSTESSTGSGVATINWNPPTENTDGTALVDLVGYKIYYGTAPDSLFETIIINNSGLSSYVIDNLVSNTTYYFSVTAVNGKGIESASSNIVSKYSS